MLSTLLLWWQARAELGALLKRTFFKPTTTYEQSQVTLLGLFCCPKLDHRARPLQRIELEKEMRDAIKVLPRHERELRPAACFPRDLLSPLGKGDAGAQRLLPRVLHFCAHSEHSGIIMEREEGGRGFKLTPDELVVTLRECVKLSTSAVAGQGRSSIECVFLNCCNTFELAKVVHAEFPWLMVISWKTLVDSKAACEMAAGFYAHLGERCEAGDRNGCLLEAFAQARPAQQTHTANTHSATQPCR